MEFAIEHEIASPRRPSSIFSLVRRSRVAFARAHHPAYEHFLRRRLEEEEEIEGIGRGAAEGDDDDKQVRGGGALHPLAWRPSASADRGDGGKGPQSAPAAAATVAGERTVVKLEKASEKLENVVSAVGDDEEEDEDDLLARAASRVAELESALGRGRKSRLSGAKDRPRHTQRPPLARLQGSPEDGDALLDLGQEEIVAYVDSATQQRRLGA